jgi:hypothetical protein
MRAVLEVGNAAAHPQVLPGCSFDMVDIYKKRRVVQK